MIVECKFAAQILSLASFMTLLLCNMKWLKEQFYFGAHLFHSEMVYLHKAVHRFQSVLYFPSPPWLTKITEPPQTSVVVSFVCMWIYTDYCVFLHFWGQDWQHWAQYWLPQDATALHLPPELLFNHGCLLCALYLSKRLLEAAGTWPERVPGEVSELVTTPCKYNIRHSGISYDRDKWQTLSRCLQRQDGYSHLKTKIDPTPTMWVLRKQTANRKTINK